MKTLLITGAFVFITLISYSQTIYQIRADSVRIYNTCDTAELILENRTQNVPGFLYNKGRGRTEFRKLTFDTTLVLGAYKNNAAGDSVLTTDSNGVVKLVHKSTLGGAGIPTLQQVTDTGNTTTNQLRITGNNRTPELSGPAMEVDFITSDEYLTQGPLGTIRVRDRLANDEEGYNNSASGFLSLDVKGMVLENKLKMPEARAVFTVGDPGLYLPGYGGPTIQSQQYNGNSWLNGGNLNLLADDVYVGTNRVHLLGAVALQGLNASFSTFDQYVGPQTSFYLVRHTFSNLFIPPANDLPGRVITIKKVINNNNTAVNIKVDGGAGTIDNQAAVTLSGYLSVIQLMSDGTNWWVLYRLGN